MNDFDEYVDEDNIDEVLHKAVEEIKTAIEGDQDNDSIIEYKPFILSYQLLNTFTTNLFQITSTVLELWI